MTTCSRCGTTDERHTKKCYEAMVLGWALGIEKRPAAAVDVALEDRLRTIERSIDAIATMLAEPQVPEFGMDSIGMSAAEVAAMIPAPVTHLPAGYYDHTQLHTTPARDDDYTPEAMDRTAPAPEPVQASEPETEPIVAAEPEPAPIPEPAPAPEPVVRTGRVKTPSVAVEAWLNDMAYDDPDGRIIVATADEVYATWAADKPEMPEKISSLTVAKALKGRGYKRRTPIINGRQYPCYYGVRLTTPEREPDGNPASEAPPEHVAIAERYVTARTKPKPGGFVAAVDMYASYQRWCERTGQPDIGRDKFSLAMLTLGAYRKGGVGGGQTSNGNRYGYFDVELTPEPLASGKPEAVPDNQTIRKAIKAAQDAVRAQREAEEAAAETPEPETPAVVYRVREPEAEKKPDNNGWGKTFNTDNVAVATLSVEDIAAEHAAMETGRSDKYQGPRPGPKMDGETRDLINAILDLNLGWEFVPPSGRTQSHSYLVSPDGVRFSQASSMGGSIGRIGNNRELRRYLNRKGYLPTAGAPAAELTAPSAKVKRPTPKVVKPKSEINVGSKPLADYLVQVEAEPDAKPLTEEEMDKDLFDLYVDVRAGYDGPFSYHPDVESLYGLDKDGITAAVRSPERVEVRPESKPKGYPVIKFAKGDVIVIMGYRDRKSPAVIRAEWGHLLGHDHYEVNRHGGGGSKAATGLPNSYNQLRPRLIALGAEVTPNEDGKTAAVTYQGQNLGLITKEKCPRATTHSDWNRMQRKIQAINRREPAAV